MGASSLNDTLVAVPAAGGGEVWAVVLAEGERPLPIKPVAASTETKELGVGHLSVDDVETGGIVQTVSGGTQDLETDMVAPAYAAGAISEASSIHNVKQQQEDPTLRR